MSLIMTLDSAQRFNQDNYRGKIREVGLEKESQKFDSLDAALAYAHERGYTVQDINILNVSHGESERNEPTEAILLTQFRGTRTRLEECLIVKENSEPPSYNFYQEGDFRFIP